MDTKNKFKKFPIRMPDELVSWIDQQKERRFNSRTGIINQIILKEKEKNLSREDE